MVPLDCKAKSLHDAATAEADMNTQIDRHGLPLLTLAALALCCATAANADVSHPIVKPASAAIAPESAADQQEPVTPLPPPQRIRYASLIMAQAPVLPTAPAAGGGAGKVWVNTATHVYYCSGDAWYGKTRDGQYMTLADAKAVHAHAHRGKRCS
jgi:hypothetical protein